MSTNNKLPIIYDLNSIPVLNESASLKKCLDLMSKLGKGISVLVDTDNKSIGAKIRHATLQKIPYMAIMGDKEVSLKSLSVRARDGHDLGSQTVEEFTHKLITDIENHT